MNERIRELAEVAGLEYNFYPMLWLKYEKFAELIVRECIEAHADYYGVDIVSGVLKEHFGIKK